MSDPYLDGKVREALTVAKGARAMAQKTLMVWALKDDRLLKAMVMPFLKAIAGAALETAIKRGVAVPGMQARAATPLPPAALDQVLSQMGRGAPTPGGAAKVPESAALAERLLGPSSGPEHAGSKGQSTALRAIAAAFAKQKGR